VLFRSYAAVHRDEGYGVFSLGNKENWSQLFTQTAYSLADRLSVRLGGDLDWREARFIGSIPETSADRGTGAPSVLFNSRADGSRNGAFAESDWRALEDLRLIVGLRSDYSSFTHQRTVDPRLSAAYKVGDGTVTAAAGGYHQVSDPLYFADGIGTPGLGPMSSRQYVLGYQLGEDKQVVRVELYDKRYHDLVGLTRDKDVVGGGVGEARGADVFVRRNIGPWFNTRVTYTYVDSKRTDPTSRAIARAPFDITNSITLIGDQALPKGWDFSFAFRYATGKPFTPVVGAAFNAQRRTWDPIYGSANSERLPSAQKVDLSLSRVTRLSPRTILVYFFSLDNVLDRENIYQYTYNADYSQRIPVRSLFKRSFYVGASLTHYELVK